MEILELLNLRDYATNYYSAQYNYMPNCELLNLCYMLEIPRGKISGKLVIRFHLRPKTTLVYYAFYPYDH